MEYRDYEPAPALRPFVDRLWSLESATAMDVVDPIFPDGHPEIIVHGGAPFVQRMADGSLRTQRPVLFSGQLTRALWLAPRGRGRIAGARLLPGAGFRLFGVRQDALVDLVTPLSTLNRVLARRLGADVAKAAPLSQMVPALEAALVAFVAGRPGPAAEDEAAAYAQTRRGLVSVADLAAHVNLGARQIERRFRRAVGITPKQFLRIVRFQEVLRAIQFGTDLRPWSDVAAALGFYDQAHFNRDVRTFTGQAPTRWVVPPESLTAIFSQTHRKPRRPPAR